MRHQTHVGQGTQQHRRDSAGGLSAPLVWLAGPRSARRPTATYFLLDEPAAGLPSSDSEVPFDFLQMLPKDVSILVVEHDMNLVFRFAFLRVARIDEA